MESGNARPGFSSPKKKSSFRSKLGSSVENIREGFKNCRDISARSLMDRLNDDSNSSCSSESIIEEVVDLEDEDSSGVYDEVEYVEEVVDDSSDSSIMEELPPPISIPKELQVKDSDDEEPQEDSSGSDSSDSDDSEPPISSSARPNTIRGTSFLANETAKPVKKEKPVMQPTIEDLSTNNEESEGEVYAPPEQTELLSQTKSPPKTTPVVSSSTQDERSDLQWSNPGWTKDSGLKSTGRETAQNLAKPITTLPHLRHGRKNSPVSPKSRDFAKAKVDVSSPETKSPVAATPYPKSAPTKSKQAVMGCPPVAGARDDEKLGKIEWRKPDWMTKKILRDTSKGHKLMSGEDLGRPIGGIRPVDDSA